MLYKSSAKQADDSHESQDLFPLKKKVNIKLLECRLLQILLGLL